MGQIKISRKKEFINSLRKMELFIDDKKIGYIKNGETKEIPVDEGNHKLYAKLDWGSSQAIEFYCGDKETKSFYLGGFKNSNLIMRIALVILSIDLVVRLSPLNFNYLIYFTIPFFLIVFYYISFGRDRYLTLKDAN